MPSSLPLRRDVDSRYTWDTHVLYPNDSAFAHENDVLTEQVHTFRSTYEQLALTTDADWNQALQAYQALLVTEDRLAHYAELNYAVDQTNTQTSALLRRYENAASARKVRLTFFEQALKTLSAERLQELGTRYPEWAPYMRHLQAAQAIRLNPEVEQALTALAPSLNNGENLYTQMRAADFHFDPFTVNHQTYPLSFTLYEDHYAYHPNPAIRRAAFTAFSNTLAHYQHTAASIYYQQVATEKRLATLHGFDSVIDYLLYDQEVTREMFDRQLDIIIDEFGPVMQRYMRLLQQEHSLDDLTFADRLIDLDPDYAPTVTIEQAHTYIQKALRVLGPDYERLVLPYQQERWVDYVQNQGKETGGFCAQPYGQHPFILMSWTGELADVYTLIHELGHAGQGLLAQQKHGYLAADPSTYIIEAPSTFNELLLNHSLLTQAQHDQNPRLERFALTKLLSNTYFHNFITHLLEAAYQREVYQLIDAGESFTAETLNAITLKVYTRFFGDTVTMLPGSELTWMRQSHYYMGLYSYVYSASLTVSTAAYLQLQQQPDVQVPKWLEFLGLGDTLDPIASAAVAGVDITTDQPLHATIDFLDKVVQRVTTLTTTLK